MVVEAMYPYLICFLVGALVGGAGVLSLIGRPPTYYR